MTITQAVQIEPPHAYDRKPANNGRCSVVKQNEEDARSNVVGTF